MAFEVTLRGDTYEFRLGVVDLSAMKINDISEIQGLDKLTKLTRLNLSNNNITDIHGLENLTNLAHLNLSNNNISEIKGLENLTNLTYLFLSNNKITKIQGLENLVNLTNLYLGKNQINEIKGFDNLKKLRNLHLNNNVIDKIEGLDNLTSLEKLFLEGNNIPDELINKLGGFGRDKVVKWPQKLVKYCKNGGKIPYEKPKGPYTMEDLMKLGQKQLEQFSSTNIELIKASMEIDLNPPFSAFDYISNKQNLIFVSYAHRDKHEVYPIIKELHDKGFNIWYDEGIPITDEFRRKIADALNRCNIFVVFISYNSIRRPYVIREINFALNRYDQGEIKILPIFLNDISLPVELEFSLGGIQSLLKFKMESDDFSEKLHKELNKIIS